MDFDRRAKRRLKARHSGCAVRRQSGPDRDPVEAAKWAHLYLTNPTRLNLGAPVLAQGAIDALEVRLDRETWLAGKERARTGHRFFHRPQKALNLRHKKIMKNKQKNTLSRIALLGFVSFILTNSPALAEPNHRTAYFAGGCFWCTETDFEKIDGVSEVISGFMGGEKANPSYDDVASGRTNIAKL